MVTKADIAGMQSGWLWDDAVPGLGVRCTAGGARAWVLRYRTKDRKQRSQTLGNATVLHPKQARELARRVLADVAQGADPLAESRVRQAEPTVADLEQRYTEEHAPKKKARSRENDADLWRNHLLPMLGRTRISDVTPATIAELLHQRRKTPVAANRAVRLLSKAFNLARRRAPAWGWPPVTQNPCERAELHPERRRKRYLHPEEAARLTAALEQCPNRTFVALVRLLLLTGARLGEWRDARWDWVDLRAGLLRLPDSKTGEKDILLTQQVVDILARLPRSSPYVLPGRFGNAPMSGEQKAWKRLCKAAGIEGLRIHDLRHSYAATAVSAGLSLPEIGGLLGHRSPQTTARYAHLMDAAARAAAQKVAGMLDSSTPGFSNNRQD